MYCMSWRIILKGKEINNDNNYIVLRQHHSIREQWYIRWNNCNSDNDNTDNKIHKLWVVSSHEIVSSYFLMKLEVDVRTEWKCSKGKR